MAHLRPLRVPAAAPSGDPLYRQGPLAELSFNVFTIRTRTRCSAIWPSRGAFKVCESSLRNSRQPRESLAS